MPLLAEAIAWYQAGYMPLPVKPDGSKAPAVPTWTAYQKERPSLTEVVELFKIDSDGIGLLCGAVSGGLEMLELEGRAFDEGYDRKLVQAFKDHDLQELWNRIAWSGYFEITPSRGIHYYYRVDGHTRRNTKLARRPGADGPEVLIETRGEGGFTVIAPSAGRSHSTGQSWAVGNGHLKGIPIITEDERDAIHAIASTLDQMPVIEPPPPSRGGLHAVDSGLRPGDDFNVRATWKEILEPHGWKAHKHYGRNLYGWRKPGKRHPGISATTGRNDADRLYVFSTSTPFEAERPYSKFGAYALLDHGGDFGGAARALRAAGYGGVDPIAPKDPAPSAIHSPPELHAVNGANAIKTEPRAADASAFGATEDGTARALATYHADTLRYCPQRGMWLQWTGSRWAWDTAEMHRECIRDMARELPDVEGWKNYKKRALSASGVAGIARLAQSDSRLTVHIDELDANPYELNTPDGIINLRTGERRIADPKALHTRSTNYAPDYDRKSELLDSFLRTTFGADPHLIAYIQRLFGLSLIGTVLEQLLLFAYGVGANGKSTLLETVIACVGRNEGGYSIVVPSEMLMVRKHTEHPAELAQLAGTRLVVCSELEDGQRFAEARIKMLTGRDSVNARFMRRDPFTFTPTWTLWLIGNQKPDATTGGPAFWRRMKMLPFAHVVPEGDRDPNLPDKLLEEAPAILAWIARGAALYHQQGLATPDIVSSTTEAYRHDQDTVERFVSDKCHRAPNDLVRVAITLLRDKYERWCYDNGETPVTAKRLTQDLHDKYGIRSDKGSKGQRFYFGICHLEEEQES